MSAATIPTWHDPDAPRCARDDCGHVEEAHHAGPCALIYCVCRGFISLRAACAAANGAVV